MFSEILKIIPKLDSGDLSKMERALSKRFGNIAKKFGKGLLGALTGGGIAGIALGLIDKLLNPLKETQAAIDRVLKQGDDIVINAKQFGTTAGKLFKLQSLAQSTGVDAGTLNVMLEKFQGAVANATINPNDPTNSSVRNFVGNKDTAEAFYEFIQSLQKVDKTQQVLIEQQVFGERQVLNAARFIGTDFAKQNKLVGAKSAETYTPGLEKASSLNNLKNALEARRNLDDTLKKSGLINKGMVTQQDEQAKIALQKENAQIQSYQSLATISDGVDKVLATIEQGFLKLSDLVVKVTNLTEIVKKFSGTRLLRGIFGGGDK